MKVTPFDDNYFQKINKKLSFNFSRLNLLKRALTHRSYLNENPKWKEIGHNERLEFLGDAVLGFLVAEYLYKRFPQLPEGELSFLKSALTNEKILLEVAKELNLKDLVLISKGEKEKITYNDSLLADTVEALIGALYLEKGIKAVRNFIKKYIFSKLRKILKEQKYRDPKSLFQEKTQMIFKLLPTYKLIESWGPQHQKKFKVALYLKDQMISEGVGSSLKEAEERAAEKALEILEKNNSYVFKKINP
jgi:ribonuclease-3